jgi:hypothetical protein
VRLEAVAFDGAGANGEYEFIVTKRDSGGESNIVQGGEFELLAGESQVLGEAEFSLERRGRYDARLELRDGELVMCSAEAAR